MAAEVNAQLALTATCATTVTKIKRCAVRHGGASGPLDLAAQLGLPSLEHDNATDYQISRPALVDTFAKFGIVLNDLELKSLFAWLDRTAEGRFAVAELVAALRHVADPTRRSLIHRAFNNLPKAAGTPYASLDGVRRLVHSAAHPRVVRGDTDAATVEAMHMALLSQERFPTGKISEQEFTLLFSGISATIDCDNHFAAYVRGCWRLPHLDAQTTRELCASPEDPNAMRATSKIDDKARLLQRFAFKKALDAAIDEHRASVVSNAGGARAVGGALRALDAAQTGYIPVSQFLEALSTLRLYLPSPEVPLMFFGAKLGGENASRTDLIDYEAYLAALFGELPAARQVVVEAAWKAIAGSSVTVPIHAVVKRYVAPSGAALSLFLDAWDERKAVPPLNRVTFAQFWEWFVPMSAQTKLDTLFLEQVKQQWCP